MEKIFVIIGIVLTVLGVMIVNNRQTTPTSERFCVTNYTSNEFCT